MKKQYYIRKLHVKKNKQKLITKEKTHNLLMNCYIISFKRVNSNFFTHFYVRDEFCASRSTRFVSRDVSVVGV